jgi:beta-glucanase (GH16 family)
VAADAGKHWNVSFTQEFNGTDYDHNQLTPCFDWNYGGCTSTFNNGYEHYDPGQVTVSGGLAHLLAQPLSPAYTDSACYTGKCTYASGLLSTARPTADNNPPYLYTFTYGYVEASLKPLNQQGFFTAFWMLPANTSYSYSYEIDILEQLGIPHPSDMEMHYSYNNRSVSYTPNSGGNTPGVNNHNGACTSSIDYGLAQHRYGVDWEPTHVAFYIDGVKCGEFDGTAGGTISNLPMQLILDQMVSNDWQRAAAVPLVNTSLTSDLQVDYIRVYQQAP